MAERTAVSPTAVSPSDVDPQDYVLERNGDRDLAFKGWLIGYAEETSAWSGDERRGVKVSIFATTKDNLVLQACRWSEDIDGDEDVDAEEVPIIESEETCSIGFFDPESNGGWSVEDDGEWIPSGTDAALDWLRKDARGKLGPTSKAAWVQACENWDKLAGEGVETV